MSGRWPGWRTLPGIELAPLAEKAREQGEPVRHFTYVWDRPGRNYVSTCNFLVDGDGTVSLPAGDGGWEPIVEDGMLAGLRGKKTGTIEELVQVTSVVVPEGEPPWSPALTARLPPEQIGLFRRGDAMADGIDIDHDEPHAALTIGFAGADGSWTNVVWGITSESAASVIALIRERHGEPLANFTADDGAALQEAAAEALGAHGVLMTTCTHEESGEA